MTKNAKNKKPMIRIISNFACLLLDIYILCK
jgi:hypothetical protein